MENTNENDGFFQINAHSVERQMAENEEFMNMSIEEMREISARENPETFSYLTSWLRSNSLLPQSHCDYIRDGVLHLSPVTDAEWEVIAERWWHYQKRMAGTLSDDDRKVFRGQLSSYRSGYNHNMGRILASVQAFAGSQKNADPSPK